MEEKQARWQGHTSQGFRNEKQTSVEHATTNLPLAPSCRCDGAHGKDLFVGWLRLTFMTAGHV